MTYIGGWLTGVGVVLAVLYAVAAIAAIAVGLILYRGYRVSGDRRLLLMSLGFILVSVGSVLDLASSTMIPLVSWIAYLGGYLAMVVAVSRGSPGEEGYSMLLLWPTIIAVDVAGLVAAGSLCISVFARPSPVRVQGLLLGVSHLVEALSIILASPLLLVAAVALRASALASMTIPLALASRRA